MEIITSAKELTRIGTWSKFCEVTGTNEWAVNEGLLDKDDPITISFEQLKKIFEEDEAYFGP